MSACDGLTLNGCQMPSQLLSHSPSRKLKGKKIRWSWDKDRKSFTSCHLRLDQEKIYSIYSTNYRAGGWETKTKTFPFPPLLLQPLSQVQLHSSMPSSPSSPLWAAQGVGSVSMVNPSQPISTAPRTFACFGLCWIAVGLHPWHSAVRVGEIIPSLTCHSFTWTKYSKGHLNVVERRNYFETL